MSKRRRNNFKKKEEEHRINNRIRVTEVRVVGDNIDSPGIYSKGEALSMARDMEMDLVEISPNANPPVCKIIDYKKFLYDKKKKEKELKKKSKKVQTKEIKFGPNTEENDLSYRKDNAIKFLEKGNKVKVGVFFRGRQITFKERGEKLLLEFVQSLSDHGTAENMPKLNGRKMEVIIKPITDND
jgi:translation initiation factor IF-3